MKKAIFLIIWLTLTGVLYYGGFLTSILSQAKIDYTSVFVPSDRTIYSLEELENKFDSIPIAKKSFSEYSEATIDKSGFYIRVDKINLFKRVIENVDPRSKTEYVDSWNYGVSHGRFTSTPDKIGITYLFSHALGDKSVAADENAWFSYMDELTTGDEVILYYKSKKYTYSVSEIIVVNPSATGFYTGASAVAKVRMQYCGPPTGSLEARTLVDAILVNTQDLT
jgi:sortase (surface protein transpeptidase)